MRTTLIVFGMLLWLGVGIFWVFPRKRALLRKHGMHLTNDDFIRMAKDDEEIRKVYRDTKIMIAIGLIGGALIVFTR